MCRMEAQLHRFLLFPVRPRWMMITEYQSQYFLDMWDGLGPEPRRVTQYEQQTKTSGTTLVQLIWYHVPLGFCRNRFQIVYFKPCFMALKKCRWMSTCMSYLLLNYSIIRFYFYLGEIMPFTLVSEWKAQVERN